MWVKKYIKIREILFKNWKWLFENTIQTPLTIHKFSFLKQSKYQIFPNFEALRYGCNGILVRVWRRRRRWTEIQWFSSRDTIITTFFIFILQSQIGALVELGRMAFRQGLSLLKFPRFCSHRFLKSMNHLVHSLIN